MTTPSSGSVSLTDVMAELRTANAVRAYPISLGDADVRALAGVPSGAISLSSLYGKSAYTPMTGSGVNGVASRDSTLTSGTASCSPSVTVSGGSGGNTYAWSFTSNPDTCSISNATSQSCSVSHSYIRYADGSASATLQCVIGDNTGHSITVSGVTATLSWSSTA